MRMHGEDTVLERKVLCRYEVFLFQCLSALLSVSIMMLENHAMYPACLGFHLVYGLCLPFAIYQNFHTLPSDATSFLLWPPTSSFPMHFLGVLTL